MRVLASKPIPETGRTVLKSVVLPHFPPLKITQYVSSIKMGRLITYLRTPSVIPCSINLQTCDCGMNRQYIIDFQKLFV